MTPVKQVLITGVAGFVGSNLLARLLELGYRVVGLDNLSYGQLERIKPYICEQFQFIEADACDSSVSQYVSEDTTCIIHLAEVKIPRYGNPLDTLDVNLASTENLLNAARKHRTRFILGSTDDVYGKNPSTLISEESALVLGETDVSRWSLAVSKMMAEHLCFAYQEKYQIPITILRLFGAYGRNQSLDWRGGPQSVFVTAALRQEPLPIHGDGLQTRTFTNIADIVAGTVLAMGSPYAEDEILNIASTDTLSIVNLAFLIWRLAGNPQKPKLDFIPYTDFSRNYEDAPHRVADISKARYLLGYVPEVPLLEGLRATIRWQASALRIAHGADQ
jgi:UDP-glucose 4-epimerase